MDNVSAAVSKMGTSLYNKLPTFSNMKYVNVVKQEAQMGVVAFRLQPGDDLRKSLLSIVSQFYNMDAAVVLTCVGSLCKCRLKLATNLSGSSMPNTPRVSQPGQLSVNTNGQPSSPGNDNSPDSNGNGSDFLNHAAFASQNSTAYFVSEECFEICSLVGTLSGDAKDGDCNLNISIADKDGRVVGGKLLDGCEIYRTAEIVLGKIAGMKFKRTYDSETGYFELQPVVKPPGGGNG